MVPGRAGSGASWRRVRADVAKVLAVGAVAVAVGAAPAASQGDGWAALFPEARGLGPPAWVQVGSRITFYQSSASVTQTRGDDARGGSGEGAMEVDVVAIDGSEVLVSRTMVGWDRASDVRTYAPLDGHRMPGAAVDTVWLHPDLLTSMLEGAGPGGFDAVRLPYDLLGTTFDAVRVSTGTTATTFDSATGLVLTSTIGTATPGGGAANSEGSYQQLLSSRTRQVPGLGAPLPAWLQEPTTLTYTGTWYTSAFGVEAAAQMEIRFDPVSRDAAYAQVSQVLVVATVPTREGHGAIAGGAGPYWYDPTALAGMRQGDVLDSDPITGARTTVTAVEQGPRGAQVRIVMAMNGSRLETTYDQATGMLLVYDLTQDGYARRIRVSLTR